MHQAPSVFISYPHDGADAEELAHLLFERLSAEGISVFYDKNSIKMGDRWVRMLSDNSKHCQIMLCVVSPAAHDRPWVEKEFIASSGAGAKIIPVLSSVGELPFQLNDLQALQAYGSNKTAAIDALVERVQILLGVSKMYIHPTIKSTYRSYNKELFYLSIFAFVIATILNSIMAIEKYTLVGLPAYVFIIVASAIFAALFVVLIVRPLATIILTVYLRLAAKIMGI